MARVGQGLGEPIGVVIFPSHDLRPLWGGGRGSRQPQVWTLRENVHCWEKHYLQLGVTNQHLNPAFIIGKPQGKGWEDAGQCHKEPLRLAFPVFISGLLGNSRTP